MLSKKLYLICACMGYININLLMENDFCRIGCETDMERMLRRDNAKILMVSSLGCDDFCNIKFYITDINSGNFFEIYCGDICLNNLKLFNTDIFQDDCIKEIQNYLLDRDFCLRSPFSFACVEEFILDIEVNNIKSSMLSTISILQSCIGNFKGHHINNNFIIWNGNDKPSPLIYKEAFMVYNEKDDIAFEYSFSNRRCKYNIVCRIKKTQGKISETSQVNAHSEILFYDGNYNIINNFKGHSTDIYKNIHECISASISDGISLHFSMIKNENSGEYKMVKQYCSCLPSCLQYSEWKSNNQIVHSNSDEAVLLKSLSLITYVITEKLQCSMFSEDMITTGISACNPIVSIHNKVCIGTAYLSMRNIHGDNFVYFSVFQNNKNDGKYDIAFVYKDELMNNRCFTVDSIDMTDTVENIFSNISNQDKYKYCNIEDAIVRCCVNGVAVGKTMSKIMGIVGQYELDFSQKSQSFVVERMTCKDTLRGTYDISNAVMRYVMLENFKYAYLYVGFNKRSNQYYIKMDAFQRQFENNSYNDIEVLRIDKEISNI